MHGSLATKASQDLPTDTALPPSNPNIEPLYVSIQDTGRITGLSAVTIYRLLAAENLVAVKSGAKNWSRWLASRHLARSPVCRHDRCKEPELSGEDFAAGPGRAPAAGEDGSKYSAGDARSNVHADSGGDRRGGAGQRLAACRSIPGARCAPGAGEPAMTMGALDAETIAGAPGWLARPEADPEQPWLARPVPGARGQGPRCRSRMHRTVGCWSTALRRADLRTSGRPLSVAAFGPSAARPIGPSPGVSRCRSAIS